MYLAYKTRPDIAFMVGQLTKYNANPRKSHLQVAKKVVRYLKGIMQMGLVFRKKVNSYLLRDPLPYDFIRYVDSNFARDSANRK